MCAELPRYQASCFLTFTRHPSTVRPFDRLRANGGAVFSVRLAFYLKLIFLPIDFLWNPRLL